MGAWRRYRKKTKMCICFQKTLFNRTLNVQKGLKQYFPIKSLKSYTETLFLAYRYIFPMIFKIFYEEKQNKTNRCLYFQWSISICLLWNFGGNICALKTLNGPTGKKSALCKLNNSYNHLITKMINELDKVNL
jgi:hypothetical protein